jgi:hypothetical protein
MGQAIDLNRHRAGQHRLRGALGNKERFAGMFGQNRSASPLEIKPQLSPTYTRRTVDLARQDGVVERATNSRLEVAVDPRQFEHAVAFPALPIHVVRKRDLRLGEGSGLVDAKHIHGAEIVDRGKPFDDDLLQSHALGAAGQRHRHDHRQQLGREANRQGHCKQDRLHGRPI